MPSRPSPRGERGAVAVTIAAMLAVLLVLAAFVLDVGMATLARRQLQNAADAAALAAALELDGTDAGLTRARERAEAVAARHAALQDPVVLGSGGGDGTPDVQFGAFDLVERTFTETADPREANAVRIQARRYAIRGQGIATVFGRLAGIEAMDVGSDAIAVGGGIGQVECAAPLTVPRCTLDLNPNFCTDPTPLTFNPSTTNTIGFAVIGDSASTTTIAQQITACRGYTASEDICLANGANLASNEVYRPLVDLIRDGEPWDDPSRPLPPQDAHSAIPPPDYGKVWRSWMPVIDDGGEFCSPPDNYNTCGWRVVGFVPLALFDVVPHGPVKTVYGFIDCDADLPGGYGGGLYAGIDSRPRLVR